MASLKSHEPMSGPGTERSGQKRGQGCGMGKNSKYPRTSLASLIEPGLPLPALYAVSEVVTGMSQPSPLLLLYKVQQYIIL